MKRLIPGWVQWPQLDIPLLLSLLLLMAFGLLVLYSASGASMDVVYRQATRLGVGLAALLLLSQVPPHILRIWTPWLYALGVILLLATWLVGVGRGADRWLDLGLFRFQPSEIMKLAVPMMMAWYLHPRRLPPESVSILVSSAIIIIPAVLIARQPDLGTALLVAVSGGFALFLSGLQWRVIFGMAAALWLVMHEYQRDRVRTFLDPESDPLGSGWNIIQSKIAVGSGGLTGKGWLNVLFLFAIYLFIAGRGLYIASMARTTYARLLAGSLSLTFMVYVLVNAGMVSGLLPVVGVPLPLISYGGTSVVTLLAGFGILMSIYGHRNFIR